MLMKLRIEQSEEYDDVEITVRCGPMIDERLKKLLEQIRLYSFSIPARRDGRLYQIDLSDIYYFECVDEKTFVYLKAEVYQCDGKLYELESRLAGSSFARINKQTILNTNHLQSVKPLLNGKLEALMENGEKLFVNRHYVADFKSRFGL